MHIMYHNLNFKIWNELFQTCIVIKKWYFIDIYAIRLYNLPVGAFIEQMKPGCVLPFVEIHDHWVDLDDVQSLAC